MTPRIFSILAWLCLAAVVFATLGPLGLRPISGMSPQIERFVAFGIVGFLFGAAYPRYFLFAAAIVLGAAVLLELLQVLVPSRHGRLFDAAVKIAGGTAGLSLGWVFSRLLLRR